MKITKDSTVESILNHPKGREVLAKHQVPCMGCPMAAMELSYLKIGDVAEKYDLDIESILEDINEE